MGNLDSPTSDLPSPTAGGSGGAAPDVPIAVTVIIPAYNEAGRLPRYLRDVRHYLDTTFQTSYELLVVDDGSVDGTRSVAHTHGRDWPQLRVICHESNRGKGAAVRTGVRAARGQRILYADADGATPIAEEAKLRVALDNGADIAVGSRYLPCRTVTRQRNWRRELVGRLFALVARRLVAVPVRDTQCGFKMLATPAAQELFAKSTEDGYLFDLEILGLAQRMNLRITEVPINWFDQPGSQLSLRRQLMRVPRDLWRVRREVRGER